MRRSCFACGPGDRGSSRSFEHLLHRLDLICGEGAVRAALLVELLRHLVLLVGEKMGVHHGHLGALVPEPVGDGKGGEAHLDEQRDMAVAQVVDSDGLESSGPASPLHLVPEEVLGDREHPVGWSDGWMDGSAGNP